MDTPYLPHDVANPQLDEKPVQDPSNQLRYSHRYHRARSECA